MLHETGSMVARRADLRAVKAEPEAARWGFLTNYAVLLAYVVLHPESTVRAISQGIGITERAALSILRALEEDGLISREKQGRRNRYWLHYGAILAHRREGGMTVLEMAAALGDIAQRV
jgi:DNA-binding transcriptional ArsR family regulator